MLVLGLSFDYHDASVCLVKDGELLSALALERLTLQKHDFDYPDLVINELLRTNGFTTKDIDFVTFHEDPFAKFNRVVTSALSHFPKTKREFQEVSRVWPGRKFWTLNRICRELIKRPDQIVYFSHHYSHALYSFLSSGFSDAIILVVDAVGDWGTCGFYRGSFSTTGEAHVKAIEEISFPHSLGLVYSAVTEYLGFNPNDSECSTMALSAFGQPVYKDFFSRIVKLTEKGFEVDTSFFHFQDFYSGGVSKRFEDEMGPSRKKGEGPYPFHSFKATQLVPELNQDDQRLADIAASFQEFFEEAMLHLTKIARAHLGSNIEEACLCLGGGVALNCLSNTKILKSKLFSRVHVPIDPGDGGSAVGPALYLSSKKGHALRGANEGYLGCAFQDNTQFDAESFNYSDLKKYTVSDESPRSIIVEEGLQNGDLVSRVAGLIEKGSVVGWFQGRSEFGPRALGNRSLLVRADDLSAVARMSQKIKKRASYRPYALSILQEDAIKFFDMPKVLDVGGDRVPWDNFKRMQFVAYANDIDTSVIAGGLHVDQSSRIQVVFEEDNSLYYQLLVKYKEISGVGAFVNTSFNESGFPLVERPIDAMAFFLRSSMDVLVLNSNVYIKEW